MASIRKRRNKWYARVSCYNSLGKKKEKQIPLRTESKATAFKRLEFIEKVEEDIQNGIKIPFPWLNVDRQIRILKLTIKEAVDLWMRSKKSSGIRQSTIIRYRCSLNSFISSVGPNFPLVEISTKVIDRYRNLSLERKLSPSGININLRSIRAFLRWCFLYEHIKKIPHIGLIRIPRTLPRYIPDRIFAEIMKLPWITQEKRNLFWFYRETGCRLSEPFFGEFIGNLMIISGEDTKQRFDREILLSDKCLKICIYMKESYANSRGTLKSWTDSISKYFLKAVREVDGKDTIYHFHCLRHTFAVRRYLQTRDIYLVKKEMGHSSVTTTEKYAEFNLHRLSIDFPSITNPKLIHEIRQSGHGFGGRNWNLRTITQGT